MGVSAISRDETEKLLDLLERLGLEPEWCNLDRFRRPKEGVSATKLQTLAADLTRGLESLGWQRQTTVQAIEAEALVQGFADCESLVCVMLLSMARESSAPALHVVTKILVDAFPGLDDSRISATASVIVDAMFSIAAEAVSLGKHRTNAYDAYEVAKAHAATLGRLGASKGGRANTPKQIEARRNNQKLAAAARRREKKP